MRGQERPKAEEEAKRKRQKKKKKKVIYEKKPVQHTLATTAELHLDLLVHVLVEIQDVFLFGLLLCTATTATFLLALSAAASTTATASE